jgi:hypothetical protein
LWKLYDEFLKRQRIPHVQISILDAKVISDDAQDYLLFDLFIKNPTEKRVFLIYSRTSCLSSINAVGTEIIPLEDFLNGINRICTQPQIAETPIYRHSQKIENWGEFLFSPVGSNYVFESGEEYKNNFCLPLTPSPRDRMVSIHTQLMFCEKIPQLQILGASSHANPYDLKATDEFGELYEGPMVYRLLRLNKVLYFQTTKNIPVKARNLPKPPQKTTAS